MKYFAILLAIVLIDADLFARTWTSADGTALEAELVSSTDTHVTIRRTSDGRRFTLPLKKLSEADRKWLADGAAANESSSGKLPKDIAALVKEQGKVLFEDNFNREDSGEKDDLGENWTTNSKSRAQGEKQNDLIDGELVMTISPKADHAISTKHNTAEPYKDVVVYLRMKLEEGDQLKLAYNDTSYKGVWAGHINGVTINPKSVLIADEKSARFDLKFREIKGTPEGKAALDEAMATAEKKFPIKLKTGEWHDVVTLHKGKTLTVFIDGKEVGKHTSPGFGHETKRQFVFAVPKKAIVDDLRIWKLSSAKSPK